MAVTVSVTIPVGLDDRRVAQLREKWGTNEISQVNANVLKNALGKFWAPVPWMLEVAILIQISMGDWLQALVVAALLLFNGILGFFQEASAQKTLAALMARLPIQCRAQRNGAWCIVPSAELVPGDVVRLGLGEVVPADVNILQGDIQVDQSMLTGESMPVDLATGAKTYAGALVQRGAAVAEVTGTGTHTVYGQTANLVKTSGKVSSQRTTVQHVVRNLVLFNGALILLMVGYGLAMNMPKGELVHLLLTALLASIPVALPATFTLAGAFGARTLARRGVLATRLSAVDEAATMTVLCVDKTGTLTRNALAIQSVHSCAGINNAHLLNLARLCSDSAGNDPVDNAIQLAAKALPANEPYQLISLIAFDPVTKMAQATIIDPQGVTQLIVKGAFAKVAALIHPAPDTALPAQLEQQGCRVLAVASGLPGALRLVGLIALTDPPRDDAPGLIAALKKLGIRIIMLTGDAAATAANVAQKVGITGASCAAAQINDQIDPQQFGIFSEVLPADKFRLVQLFQKCGYTVGMCGDGANDAPALRQAQIGIAVSSATDVAKSASGMVLTEPGLSGIVAAIGEGRIAFQRILTYTLNSITKKIVQILFLVFGLVLTGHAILTPILMAIIMICGDFLGLSLTTDNVTPSTTPNSWQINRLTIAGVAMGVGELAYCAGLLSYGWLVLGLALPALQSLAFVVLVFGNQATTYTNRVRGRLWTSKPGSWVLGASLLDTSIAAALAWTGTAMAPLSIGLIAGALALAVLFTFILDLFKVPLFVRLGVI